MSGRARSAPPASASIASSDWPSARWRSGGGPKARRAAIWAISSIAGRRRRSAFGPGEIVPAAADALERQDRDALGSLAARSQRLAETRLGNQVPETVFLARAATEVGAFAASAFGAGWGGAVWALVERDAAEEMQGAWAAAYRARFPEAAARAEFFTTGAGSAAAEL